jgi:hypothetical protein
MGAVQDLIKKLKVEAPKQEAAILDIVADNENLMIDMNTAQLMNGIDSEDGQLLAYSSESYARMKASLNPKKVTDLKLHGDFHRSFAVITDKWPVIFTATDSKKDKLEKKYGDNIFGLTEQNQAKLAQDFIKDDVIAYYRQVFQL